MIRVNSILSFFFFVSIYSCTTVGTRHVAPIFFYQELQDSIEAYVRATPPIENEYGLPTITQVILDFIDGDTLAIVRPSLSPYPVFTDSTIINDRVIGAGILSGRICEIVYGRYSGRLIDFSRIVNENSLTIKQDEYDSNTQLPPEVLLDDLFYRSMIKVMGDLDRVYIINRPKDLKLYIVNKKNVSERDTLL